MSKKRIAISAGHFPAKPGAVATMPNGLDYIEHDLATQVINELSSLLDSDDSMIVEQFKGTLTQKVDAINRWGAEFALEIHFNDAADDSIVGTENLYHSGSTRGKLAAEAIQHSLIAALDTVDRGAKVGWYQGQVGKPLYFLTNTNMPAVIVEVCFLHFEDLLNVIGIPPREDWYAPVADAIADGVRSYFSGDESAISDDVAMHNSVEPEHAIPVRVPEIELMQQLGRFKNVRYRSLNDFQVKYPIPVLVGDRMIQGNSHTAKLDCSTFVESFVIGGMQRIVGDRLKLTEEQHKKLINFGDDFSHDGPIHVFEELGLGESLTKKRNGKFPQITRHALDGNLAWSVFQGWRNEDKGHQFLIYKSKEFGNTTKHLILECNLTDNINGVGVRRYGNFDDDRFASILTGGIDEIYWIDTDHLLQSYPELYGAKLNSIIV